MESQPQNPEFRNNPENSPMYLGSIGIEYVIIKLCYKWTILQNDHFMIILLSFFL